MKEMNADQLLRDVSGHVMTIARDDEVYRHLIFRHPDNYSMWFELTTWPGSLIINSDMGTWSFSRVPDMFTFFRSSKDLGINAHYWREKITSESRFGGPSMKFQPDLFKAAVLSSLDGYDLSERAKAEIVEELSSEVFNEDDETMARRALADFRCGEFEFSDPWEIDGDCYTYHFLWCLYAIVWGIQQYDAMREKVAA
jgi:hypothetical protein